ncbi:MAG: hypothetical protein IJT38_03760 [Clostridia bacterium]|nr:hypothetical protein [Clostridia bacterium]
MFDIKADIYKNTDDSWQVKIYLTSYLTDITVKGKIVFTSPECIKGQSFDISSTPGELTTYAVCDVPSIGADNGYCDLKFNFVTNSRTYPYDFCKAVSLASPANGIVIDGVIEDGEWNSACAIVTDEEQYASHLKGWAGKEDMSAKSYIAWDNERFYFCGETLDNTFATAEEKPTLWQGDSIQIVVYHDSENNHYVPGEAGKTYHELGLASVNGVPCAYKLKAQTDATQTGEMTYADFALTNDGNKNVFEFSIKWSDLFGYEYTPSAGDTLGFSVVYNDNDGEGRRGFVEYCGITDPNALSQLYLMNTAPSKDEISVYVNDKKLSFDSAPVIVQGRTLVPLRAIFEELGADVSWEDETKTAYAEKDGITLSITIGGSVMTVGGKEIALDVPPQLVKDRTLVPLRAVSEAFGNTVDWIDETKTVIIH